MRINSEHKRLAKRHNRLALGPCRVWRKDGTPYSPEDYRRANLPVPTPKQLALWAEQDQERTREPR